MRIELAKLIFVGTRITYQATGDAGYMTSIKDSENTLQTLRCPHAYAFILPMLRTYAVRNIICPSCTWNLSRQFRAAAQSENCGQDNNAIYFEVSPYPPPPVHLTDFERGVREDPEQRHATREEPSPQDNTTRFAVVARVPPPVHDILLTSNSCVQSRCGKCSGVGSHGCHIDRWMPFHHERNKASENTSHTYPGL